MRVRWLFLAVTSAVLFVTACSSNTSAVFQPAGAPPKAAATGLSQRVPPPPAYVARATTVRFASLPAGTYPVHLHARCSGAAPFHIAVIGTLTIGAGGQGSITVPNPDFDHGWCLIVYRSTSLQTVLATRAI